MSAELSRRTLLAGVGAVAGGVAVMTGGAAAAAAPAVVGPVRIRPGDPRYAGLLRGNNFRFVGRPDEIRVADSADQVVRAVAEAVHGGVR